MKLRQPTFPFLLGLLILLGIIVNITVTVTTQKQKYLTFHYWQTYPSLEKTYISSQYVNKHPKGWIPDEVVNAYAGGALIKGVDPVLIIPDTPPLGKYLIGLSALIFNNENIITLFCAIISLVLLYLIGKQIFSSSLIALLPPFFLSFEPIFKNQLIYSPLYDMIQLVFLLAGFYFFNEGFLTKKKNIFFFILTSIFLGFFISTKFFITGLPIIGAYLFVLLFHKQKKKIISISLSLILTPLILFLSYFRVFAFDKNIHTFLGIQKWILLYHKSQLILPFSIWPLLLFNRWYVWFGDKPFISDGQWQITWPMITIFSLVAIILYAFHILKHNKAVEVLMLWTILYFLLFSFGQITSRYFVILIPVLYVIATYLCVSFLKKDFSLKNGRDFFKAMQKFMKKKNLSTSTILLFCVIFLAIIFTILPFLHKGFFPTLDDVHVLRIDMMTRELRSGQFPVRYVNDLGNGGGYFLFNFYFPGIYYVGAMLHMIGIPLVKATKFTFISLYFIGASGMFFLTKRYTDKITALIASILFITSSYFAFDIYTRGDLSETAGLTLIPWVFFFFLENKTKKYLE